MLYNEPTMIRTIFWALVFLLALSFFGISLQAIVSSPAGQANFAYINNLLSQVWQWFYGIVSLLPRV